MMRLLEGEHEGAQGPSVVNVFIKSPYSLRVSFVRNSRFDNFTAQQFI